MGIFSKVFKGVKKVFKKVGRGIKSAFKKAGKFMGKLGFLGTIGLSILTGGLGIGSMFGKFGTYLQSVAGDSFLGKALKGVAWTIDKAQKFGNTVRSGFKTLTDGVTTFLGETGKYIGGKLGMGPETWQNMSWNDVWSKTSGRVGESWNTFKADLFSLKDGPLTIDIKRDATGKRIESFDDALARAQKEGKIIVGEGGRIKVNETGGFNKVRSGTGPTEIPTGGGPDETGGFNRLRSGTGDTEIPTGSGYNETGGFSKVRSGAGATEIPMENVIEGVVEPKGILETVSNYAVGQKDRMVSNLTDEIYNAPSKFIGDSLLSFGTEALFPTEDLIGGGGFTVPYSDAFKGLYPSATKMYSDQTFLNNAFDFDTGNSTGYFTGVDVYGQGKAFNSTLREFFPTQNDQLLRRLDLAVG